MSGVNCVHIVGRLGQDPQVRYMQDGKAVCNLSVATSDEWKDKNSGEKKEKTEWHRIVIFGPQADSCGKFLSKGREVYLQGKLQTKEWEKDGIKRYTTEIVASTVQFLGSKNDSPQHGKPQVPQGNYAGNNYPQQGQQQGYQQTQQYAPAATQPPAGIQQPGQAVDDDEEIPF